MRTTILRLLGVVVWASFLGFVASAQSKEIYTGIYGLWAYGDWDAAYTLVNENNFDVCFGISNETELGKAPPNGCKIVFNFGLNPTIATDDAKWQAYLSHMKRSVQSLKNDSRIIAWYPVDEPDGQSISIEKIKIIRATIKAIDPDRPIYTVLNSPTKWKKYLPYFDIIGIDPYLQISEHPTKVSVWIRTMRRDLAAMKMVKPLWVVLGAFELKPRAPQYVSPFAKISPDTFNEMVSISRKENVDAILVWTLSFKDDRFSWNLPIDDPLLWNAVKALPQQIKAVGD